tara:strand:+ start:1485 stop:2000 length:516 start_codon:yes stop_codon:yes gene_type:complete
MIEEELLEDPKWKKILVGLTGLFLLFLILSYFLVSYPLYPILASIFESKIAENKTIELDKFSIIFTEDTYDRLQEYYYQDLSVEMVVCLKGEIKGDYIINKIYQPEILEQTYSHVSFKPCSQDSIILLHSQPFRHCIASEQDMKTLDIIKNRNKDSIMVIMCEPNRFSVYT